jgi:hypothetical protein
MSPNDPIGMLLEHPDLQPAVPPRNQNSNVSHAKPTYRNAIPNDGVRGSSGGEVMLPPTLVHRDGAAPKGLRKILYAPVRRPEIQLLPKWQWHIAP